MSFNYEVLNEEQAQKAREYPLLPDGIYDFIVAESKLKYSAKGNAMIELKLRITHDGVDFNVFDNLIATANMMWKTIHFCDTTGLANEYLAKRFNEKVAAGRRGTCQISNVPERSKNDGTSAVFKAKNQVEDYLSEEKIRQQSVAANPFAAAASAAVGVSTGGDASGFAVPAPTVPPAPGSEPFHDDDIAF